MKKIASFVLFALISVAGALANEQGLVDLSNQLADQASAAHDAALPPACGCKPSKLWNWELRGTLKDIRKIALEFRDRAAKCKGRTLVSRLKVKRIVANMQTANFAVCNGGAQGLEAFPAAWTTVRESIAKLVAEVSCGCSGGCQGGDKSVEEAAE